MAIQWSRNLPTSKNWYELGYHVWYKDEREMWEVSDVHLDEYVIKNNNQKIICTDEELRHVNEDLENPRIKTIPLSEISKVTRDIDKSLAGFKKISYAFAAFALVFTLMSIPFLLASVFYNPIAGGSYLSAILSWYGFMIYYKMDHGTLDVLEIWANNERHLLFMKKEETVFNEITTHLEQSSSATISSDTL